MENAKGKLAAIRARASWRDVVEGQLQHLGLSILLAAGALALMRDRPLPGTLLGLSSYQWAMVSIGLALLHQWLVAVVFRLQLYHRLMSRLFGERDMRIWAMMFLPLLLARPLTLLLTGLADFGTLTAPYLLLLIVGIALLVPAIWAAHSTVVHFTIPRALGGDHFRDHYAEIPLVRKGAFAVTSNAMYGLVFLGLWGIALLCGSWNALVLALFQHAYIWVHFYCTEAPDMARLYPPVARGQDGA